MDIITPMLKYSKRKLDVNDFPSQYIFNCFFVNVFGEKGKKSILNFFNILLFKVPV